jgi:hypothetical protein
MNMDAADYALVCAKCGVPLALKNIEFHYMGYSFQKELPACPVCGQPYVPESLVTGQMADVERELEDK